jgi:hypothetical protein
MAQALLKRDILRYADKAWELFNFMSRALTRDYEVFRGCRTPPDMPYTYGIWWLQPFIKSLIKDAHFTKWPKTGIWPTLRGNSTPTI